MWGRGGAGQGRLQENGNLKHSLVALRFLVHSLSFNCWERNREGKHISIHHSLHAAISFSIYFYFMYVYFDNVRRGGGFPWNWTSRVVRSWVDSGDQTPCSARPASIVHH